MKNITNNSSDAAKKYAMPLNSLTTLLRQIGKSIIPNKTIQNHFVTRNVPAHAGNKAAAICFVRSPTSKKYNTMHPEFDIIAIIATINTLDLPTAKYPSS